MGFGRSGESCRAAPLRRPRSLAATAAETMLDERHTHSSSKSCICKGVANTTTLCWPQSLTEETSLPRVKSPSERLGVIISEHIFIEVAFKYLISP